MHLTACPSCGHNHDHPFLYCQECEVRMNDNVGRYTGVTLEMPRHFTYANRDGYTQRELMRESDDHHFAEQGGRRVMGSRG